jgi:UDP-N-acetylmuramoyl-L-alanyl-D-glutamate--2,6-diaminopimelate ligase
MVRLSVLVERLGGTCELAEDPELGQVFLDSRRVGAGPGAEPATLFCALPGTSGDGAAFASEAIRRGASAVLSPRPLAGLPGHVARWIHPAARRVAGEAAALVHGEPARAQAVVAVTGTNGKSTVIHLVRQLLAAVGRRPGAVGTIECRLWGEPGVPSDLTTPDATELVRLCRRNAELGGDAFVLEASSHALDQERLSGLELDVAIFTNLGHDHLDYHRDLKTYAAAKERLFAYLKAGGAAWIHADDPRAERMLAAARRHTDRVFTYGTGSRADLVATWTQATPRGTHLFLEGMGISRTGFHLPLMGRHNVQNATAALAAVLSLGASPGPLLQGLASVSAPIGRLEEIDLGGRPFRVFVDFAHTAGALELVLTTLRELLAAEERAPEKRANGTRGRLVCVFGCGGDRDREKRGPMGAVVERLADVAIVTSDNPRSEDPGEILRQIRAGMGAGRAEVLEEPDRRRAIRLALERAGRGDVVLVAGKGHEAWQQLRSERIPFEDRRVVLEELP